MMPFDPIQHNRWKSYPKIGTITVLALANRDIPGHEQAILKTVCRIPHRCQMLMISPIKPENPFIQWLPDRDWGEGRSTFAPRLGEWIAKELHKVIKTDFVINVQADGYAMNREAWSDEFFNYDYIGAPYPIWATLFMTGSMTRRNGGAGFGWRSIKFLKAMAQIKYSHDGHAREDIYTSRVYHRQLKNMGCEYAPVDVALRWCVEWRLEDYPFWKPSQSFGFHGVLKTGQPYYTMNPALAFWKNVKWKLTNIKP